jgi:hypothetical protein
VISWIDLLLKLLGGDECKDVQQMEQDDLIVAQLQKVSWHRRNRSFKFTDTFAGGMQVDALIYLGRKDDALALALLTVNQVMLHYFKWRVEHETSATSKVPNNIVITTRLLSRAQLLWHFSLLLMPMAQRKQLIHYIAHQKVNLVNLAPMYWLAIFYF